MGDVDANQSLQSYASKLPPIGRISNIRLVWEWHVRISRPIIRVPAVLKILEYLIKFGQSSFRQDPNAPNKS